MDVTAEIPMIDIDYPAWLVVLQEKCSLASQRKVAEHLGVSNAVISQVLKQKYPGDVSRLEKKVRGAWMGETVNCPIMGELDLNKCLQYQDAKMSVVNPLRVQLYRACNGQCENSQIKKEVML
ncbi:MAG: helix-turn-helix transcriptional regulator [Oleispira sp.]|nr:helix-turn-helix transcriptional regulator [Oleispira sp.]